MGKFINPFTDVGFKRIFGQEFSKPVLVAFLNSLLEGEPRAKPKAEPRNEWKMHAR